jgi:large subunit ribosomal protein L6
MFTKPATPVKEKVKEKFYLIDIPAGIQFHSEKGNIISKGPAGQTERPFPSKNIDIHLDGNKVHIKARDKTADSRMIAGAFNSHIKNMLAGAQKPFVFKLKVVFTHFPVTVSVVGSEFLVQNFLGEKKSRKVKLPAGAKVSIKGELIDVESADLELAGKIASLIERSTKVTNRDRRVFQDGIYIIQKPK